MGLLIVIPLGGGSLIMAGTVAWALLWSGNTELSDWATDVLAQILRTPICTWAG